MRTLLTPKGRRLDNTPRPTARPGDILAWRRKRGGWTHQDVARIDGTWTPLEVALMEGQGKQTSANVARYLRALERLERDQ